MSIRCLVDDVTKVTVSEDGKSVTVEWLNYSTNLTVWGLAQLVENKVSFYDDDYVTGKD